MKTPEEFLIDQQGWSEMKKKYKGISDAIEGLCEDYAKYYHQEKIKEIIPSDEEIKQKAFDLSYVFRDDEDFKRSDAVETYCEEMGYWMKNKLTNQ